MQGDQSDHSPEPAPRDPAQLQQRYKRAWLDEDEVDTPSPLESVAWDGPVVIGRQNTVRPYLSQ